MPSLTDVYDQLVTVNDNLQQLHNDTLDEITATNNVGSSVDQGLDTVNNTLTAGFDNLLQTMQNLLRTQNLIGRLITYQIEQNNSIMCILEKISRTTCETLNETHLQTGLQTSVKENVTQLVELYKTVNPGAALELERLAHLRGQLQDCCPPPEDEPYCEYEPCPKPEQFNPEGPHAGVKFEVPE